MSEQKTEGQLLNEQLSYAAKNVWEKISAREKEEVFSFSERYKTFLNNAKTEREFTTVVKEVLQKKDFISVEKAAQSGKKLQPGDKVYQIVRNKTVFMSVIGRRPLLEGVNILGAHIDSPRIDLKPVPLYEDGGLALLKTHYYGGIKKYQWVAVPLAMHGVLVKKDGSLVEVCIGEAEEDPVFTITDLLPHLAAEQMQKKMSEGITGEGLNLLVGSIPYADEKVSQKIKLNILKILNDKYGIIEEDFISAEIEIVPAFKAKDVGFDRGLIGAYGQDDRVCAYPTFMAVLEEENLEKTSVGMLVDKEEIGSTGNTGAESVILQNYLAKLISLQEDNYSDLLLRDSLSNSKMLSADVTAGVDPNYEGVHDKKNASFIGKGITLEKYTGCRGKAAASDANAEYVGEIRNLFNEAGILWQTGEIGRVDLGGGGTIAQYIANLGVEVLDCGVPILSMHSPFEITSKVDIYMTYKAYQVFLQGKKVEG